jgi:hypothetical protein
VIAERDNTSAITVSGYLYIVQAVFLLAVFALKNHVRGGDLRIAMKIDKARIEQFIREKVEIEKLTDAQIARRC